MIQEQGGGRARVGQGVRRGGSCPSDFEFLTPEELPCPSSPDCERLVHAAGVGAGSARWPSETGWWGSDLPRRWPGRCQGSPGVCEGGGDKERWGKSLDAVRWALSSGVRILAGRGGGELGKCLHVGGVQLLGGGWSLVFRDECVLGVAG